MNKHSAGKPPPTDAHIARARFPWFLVAGCSLVIIMALLSPREAEPPPPSATPTDPQQPAPSQAADTTARDRLFARMPNPRAISNPVPTVEEIVAAKVAQFARGRRQLAHAIAGRLVVPVPDEFERFFDAAEAGRYEEMKAIYQALRQQLVDGSDPAWCGPHWRTVVETQGAADAAHEWPAQTLLDYGQSILGSLRPGMVYAGGTDSGFFIPTLLNETGEGERHLVVTQNALADNTYLQYLNLLYGDRLTTLTSEDSQRAFQEYLDDARKRLLHDQDFPGEPKQLRPGEDVRMIDGRLQVSGQIAVMSINEKLFQTLMQNNPELSFAMEQSFPLASAYAHATTLGPIMELGVRDEQNMLTAGRAAQTLDYWRSTAQQLLTDPALLEAEPRRAYSKLVSEQAALFQARNLPVEAEQAFRIANEICPSSPEAIFRFINLLVEQQRIPEAVQVAENALTFAPEDRQLGNLLGELRKVKVQ